MNKEEVYNRLREIVKKKNLQLADMVEYLGGGMYIRIWASQFARQHGVEVPDGWDEKLSVIMECDGEVREYIKLLEQRNKEEERRKAEEAEARLRAWAEEHGSERLKKMIRLRVGDWKSIAREEYTDRMAPEGYTRQLARFEKLGDRKRPTMAELEEYERMQTLCSEQSTVYSMPELVRHRHCVAVHLHVTSPDGWLVEVAKKITDTDYDDGDDDDCDE
ncbi:MAG: hypothetical protein N3E40_06440 [Dehalococcoidia bacterium]|nr:hypothetical protein [Dehalococcoidia bacterium]